MLNNVEEYTTNYTKCFVAFLDILGFKESINESKNDVTIRSRLIHALETTANLSPTEYYKRDVHYDGMNCIGVSNERQWTTQIRVFSDCVAIFVPVQTHGLSDVFFKIRYLHDRLLELRLFLRGAVTIGEMYWNDAWSERAGSAAVAPGTGTIQSSECIFDRNAKSDALITLGPALIEASILEREEAIFPRIVLSIDLIAYIEKMRKEPPERSSENIHRAVRVGFLCSPSSATATSRCIIDFIRMDSDDKAFIDLFHPEIDHNDTLQIVEFSSDGQSGIRRISDDMSYESFMHKTREAIEYVMQKVDSEKVMKKYLWLAKYFNDSIAGSGSLQIAPIDFPKWSVDFVKKFIVRG